MFKIIFLERLPIGWVGMARHLGMRPKNLLLSFVIIAAAGKAYAGECYATLRGDTLKMGNSRIERTFLWNNGNLITLTLCDKQSGKILKSKGENPDLILNRASATDGKLSVSDLPADGIHPSRTVATVSFRLGGLEVKRDYRLYPGVSAIGVDTHLRGNLDGISTHETSAADRKNIENAADMKTKPVTCVLDRLELSGNHWHGKAVEFRDITDWNNNLVDTRDFISYRRTNYRGNILCVSDGTDKGGFLFLKEAPCSGVQLAYKGGDFIADFGNFMVTGIGVEPSDLSPSNWTPTYSSVISSYGEGELSALTALREYQKQVRTLNPNRDETVMMNTWGDRSQDAKVNEAFCLAELERCARLGISLFQIDDGWQYGKSPNSAVAKGSFTDIHASGLYWKPDPVKYPNGLTPIVSRAKELGIDVGLWFNPSIQNDFADWKKDAETLLGLWEEYGIRTFKIDGLTIGNKRAETNLRQLFDTVIAKSNNEITFNLDATASRRGGYHFLNEYGNVFLENRYTDWGNYYPYQTLRNLWMLSKYVPAEKIQVEFLNKWRNAGKYGEDPYAPNNYDFSYLFAITMAGQPLAWMEANNLPEEGFEIAPLIKKYRSIQHDFHKGVILPIGEEPSGRSWTGFQSITSPEEGYLLVYRENNDAKKYPLKTWIKGGNEIILEPILGAGKKTRERIESDGTITLTLPSPNSFALYRYKLK